MRQGTVRRRVGMRQGMVREIRETDAETDGQIDRQVGVRAGRQAGKHTREAIGYTCINFSCWSFQILHCSLLFLPSSDAFLLFTSFLFSSHFLSFCCKPSQLAMHTQWTVFFTNS